MPRQFYLGLLFLLLLIGGGNIGVAQESPTTEPTWTPLIPSETSTTTPTATFFPTETLLPTETLTLTPTATLPITVSPTATETQAVVETATMPATFTSTTTAEGILPTATLPAEPQWVTTFTADFETPDLNVWLTGAGWAFHSLPTGQVLRVYHSSDPLTLNTGDYLDVAAEAQFMVDYGTAHLSVRQSVLGDYTATLDATGLVNLYRIGVLVATGQTTASTLDQWRTLRLSAVGGVLRVSVDGLSILNYTDADPLPLGKVAFHASFAPLPTDYGTPYPPVNTLLVDNFSLLQPLGNALPTPTSSATSSATPSLTASATLTSTLAWLPDTTNWQIAFAETFDTGAAKPDVLGQVGELVQEGLNWAIQPAPNQQPTWIYLPLSSNTALQLQAWLGEGHLTLYLQGGFYRAEIAADGMVQFWQGENLIQTFNLLNWNAAQWNAFRLSTAQGIVRFSVNGQEYLQIPDGAPSAGWVGFSGIVPSLLDTIVVQSEGESLTIQPELAQPVALSAQLAPETLNTFGNSPLAGYRLTPGTKLFYATRGYNFSNPPTNLSDSYRLIVSDGVNETILVQAGDLLDDGRSLQTIGQPDWSWAHYELDTNGDPVGNGLRVAFECIVEAQAQDVCFAQYNVYGQRVKLVNLSNTSERYETLTGWDNNILSWLEGEYDLSTGGVSIQRRDINDSGDANWIPAVTPILPMDTYLTSGHLGNDGFYLALNTPTGSAIYRYLFSTATLQFVVNVDGGGKLLDVLGNHYLRKYAITGCNTTPPFYCSTTWYLTWQQGTETHEINSTISSSDHEQLWANFLPIGLVVPGYTPIGLGEFKTSLGLTLNLQSPSEFATTPLLVAGITSEVYQPWSLTDQQVKGVTFGSYTDPCNDCLLPVYEEELTPTPTPCPDCGAVGVFPLESAERLVFTQAEGIYLGSASENRPLIARNTLLSEGSTLQRIGEFEVDPNLQQIAFECMVDGVQQDLCLATLETGWQVSTLQRLTNTPENEFLGGWSPDGLSLVYLTSEFASPHFGSTQVWLYSVVLGGSHQPLNLTLPAADYQVTDVLWATDGYFYYTVEGYLASATSPYAGGIYRQPTSGGTGGLWSATDLLPIPAAHVGGSVGLALNEFDAQRGLLYEAFADFSLDTPNNIRKQTYQLGVIPPNETPWLLKDITGTAEFGGAALGDDQLDAYQGSFSRGDHFILSERTGTNTHLLQAVTRSLVQTAQWLLVQLFGQGSSSLMLPVNQTVSLMSDSNWRNIDNQWVQEGNATPPAMDCTNGLVLFIGQDRFRELLSEHSTDSLNELQDMGVLMLGAEGNDGVVNVLAAPTINAKKIVPVRWTSGSGGAISAYVYNRIVFDDQIWYEVGSADARAGWLVVRYNGIDLLTVSDACSDETPLWIPVTELTFPYDRATAARYAFEHGYDAATGDPINGEVNHTTLQRSGRVSQRIASLPVPYAYFRYGGLGQEENVTGSATFVSESLWMGGLPMTYGAEDSCHPPEDSFGRLDFGWRYCFTSPQEALPYGSASNPFDTHGDLFGYWVFRNNPLQDNTVLPPASRGIQLPINGELKPLSGGLDTSPLRPFFIGFDVGYVDDLGGKRFKLLSDSVYEMLPKNDSNVGADVVLRMGDYVFLAPTEGTIEHGLLVVGWQETVNCSTAWPRSINYERRNFDTFGQSYLDAKAKGILNPIPWVVDFTAPANGDNDPDNKFETQSPVPRPFYCTMSKEVEGGSSGRDRFGPHNWLFYTMPDQVTVSTIQYQQNRPYPQLYIDPQWQWSPEQ